jgi:hypothetical protein
VRGQYSFGAEGLHRSCGRTSSARSERLGREALELGVVVADLHRAAARAKRSGLWAGDSPIAPWDFRKPAAMPPVHGMVYVTTNGKKYHTANCRHLNASAKAIPLEEAKRTREPCKACRPGE